MDRKFVYAGTAAVAGIGYLVFRKRNEIKEYVLDIRRNIHKRKFAKHPEKLYPLMQQ